MTIKELYDYCVSQGAENFKLIKETYDQYLEESYYDEVDGAMVDQNEKWVIV